MWGIDRGTREKMWERMEVVVESKEREEKIKRTVLPGICGASGHRLYCMRAMVPPSEAWRGDGHYGIRHCTRRDNCMRKS